MSSANDQACSQLLPSSALQEFLRRFQQLTKDCALKSTIIEEAATNTKPGTCELPKATMETYITVCQFQYQTLHSLGNITVRILHSCPSNHLIRLLVC